MKGELFDEMCEQQFAATFFNGFSLFAFKKLPLTLQN